MKDTYYVRRSESDKVTTFDTTIVQNLSNLVTRLSTPNKIDALKNAAESAILNPGYVYMVYKNGCKIANFVVAKEN